MEVSILIIRQERPEDYDTVYHVVKEAFENAEYTDGNEQNLVAALRKSKSFIPELSLVAVEDEKRKNRKRYGFARPRTFAPPQGSPGRDKSRPYAIIPKSCRRHTTSKL